MKITLNQAEIEKAILAYLNENILFYNLKEMDVGFNFYSDKSYLSDLDVDCVIVEKE